MILVWLVKVPLNMKHHFMPTLRHVGGSNKSSCQRRWTTVLTITEKRG